MVESFNDLSLQVIWRSGDALVAVVVVLLLAISAQPHGLMSTAGGQAQMVAVKAEKGVASESPQFPPVMKDKRKLSVTNQVSLPQPRFRPQSKASAIDRLISSIKSTK